MATGDGYKTRIARLAKSLEHYGLPPATSELVARGIILRLREWCWANTTDILGKAEDIDAACPSPLPACSLARVLARVGFLGMLKARFYMPSVYVERPTYADKRWRRRNPKGFRAAKRRALENGAGNDIEFPEEEVETTAPEPGLFDAPAKAKAVKKKARPRNDEGLPGYKEIVEYWFEQWSEVEGKGATYPYSALDGKCVKSLIQRTDDIDHAKRVINAYLRCSDRFYAGKMLKKLTGDLPRFVAAAEGTGPRGEIPYAGGDDLPRLD